MEDNKKYQKSRRSRPHFKSSFQKKKNVWLDTKLLHFQRLKWKQLAKDPSKELSEVKTKIVTLDEGLLRMRFGSTIYSIRQNIAHGHVKVNGFLIKNSSYILKQGDLVSLHLPKKMEVALKESLRKRMFFTKSCRDLVLVENLTASIDPKFEVSFSTLSGVLVE